MNIFSVHKRRETTGLRGYGTWVCPLVPCFEIERFLLNEYFEIDEIILLLVLELIVGVV